jgi:hypothetical protein
LRINADSDPDPNLSSPFSSSVFFFKTS